MDKRFLSRKFGLAAASMLYAFVALPMGWISSAEAMEWVRWTLGLYLAGNVADVAATKVQP